MGGTTSNQHQPKMNQKLNLRIPANRPKGLLKNCPDCRKVLFYEYRETGLVKNKWGDFDGYCLNKLCPSYYNFEKIKL